MDPATVRTLHDGFKRAMDTPEHEAILKKLDQPNRYMNSAEFSAFADAQIASYRQALERLGITKKE